MKLALVTLITPKEISLLTTSRMETERDGLKSRRNSSIYLTLLKLPSRLRLLKLKKMRSLLTLLLPSTNLSSNKRFKSTKEISSKFNRKSLNSKLK